MNINQIQIKIRELESNLENNTVTRVLQNNHFELDKLKNSLKDYYRYIDQISDEDLIKTIETKINELISHSNNSNFIRYSHQFINAANFLILNTPKEQKNQENNTVETIQISEEEFSKRYDELIGTLNFESEESNLVLESPNHIPFQIFNKENNLYIVPLKRTIKPMWISKESLMDAIYKTKRRLNQYEATIIQTLNDNSKQQTENLAEALKEKVSRQATDIFLLRNEIEKLQKNEEELSKAKEQFNEIFEKAENLDSKIKAIEDKAKLNASISYWQTKQDIHFKKFKQFGVGAILLILALIIGLCLLLPSHENQTSINKQTEIVKDINTTTIVQRTNENSNELQEKSNFFNFDYSKFAWYILMIFASSSVFWIIRITVKIALSNLHLSEDAHERVVMIQTYLSFVNEGQIDENDKNLILSSLFRPSNIGIIKDESSVTVADIITAFKK